MWRCRGEPPAAHDLRRPSRFEYSRVALTFDSEGSNCAGWLYRPDGVESSPVVVTVDELIAECRFGFRPYAKRLAEAGYAAFLFDYRHTGDSNGEPRNLVDPDSQVIDWHAASSGLHGRDEIDSRSLVLWGAGLSGGYASRAAAEDSRVVAVAAQNPMLDGKAVTWGRGVKGALAALAVGVRDRLQSWPLSPYRVPVVGDGSSMAVFEDPDVCAAYRDLMPPGSTRCNETPVWLFLSLLRYRALPDPDAITCPTLLVSRTHDDLASVDAVTTLADEFLDTTLVELLADHFNHYNRTFEQTFGHLLSFFRTVR